MKTSGDLPLGTQQECPRCHELIEWREIGTPPRSIRYWSDCSCWLLECDRAAAVSSAAQDHASDYVTPQPVCDVRAYQHFSLDSFDAARLCGGDKLVAAARRWLDQALPLPVADRSYADPRCCLYFHSAEKGRGKTHLASGIALAARALGKSIAILDETAFVSAYWSASMDSRGELLAAPAERAWLTVLDDMGGRENTPAGLRDVWYDVLGPRWLKRGFTIVTSNWTLDELAARGTIDDRVYSRLYQMTGGKIVTFDGTDQRLVGEAQ